MTLLKGDRKMNFDKWFNEQDRLIQVILIIIPFVGWIVEILVRLSAVLRKSSSTNILGLVLYILIGAFIIPEIIDLVYLILHGKLILTE